MPLRRQVPLRVQPLPRQQDRLQRRARGQVPGLQVTVEQQDTRPQLARDAHASAHGHDQAARDRRDIRDLVVRELRAEDPKRWTMSKLAAEVGCSKELIAYILKTTPEEETDGVQGR